MKTLSSPATFFTKFVLPTLWISAFGAAVIAMWSNIGHEHPEQKNFVIPFMIAWVIGSAFLLVTCAPLKRVRVDGDRLLISNYLREITVPLTQIQEVTENRWMGRRPVTITFKSFTDCGHSARFIPANTVMPWKPNPLVAALRAARDTGKLDEVSLAAPKWIRIAKFAPFALMFLFGIGLQVHGWIRFGEAAAHEKVAYGTFVGSVRKGISDYSFSVDGKSYKGIWPHDPAEPERNRQPVRVYYDVRDPSMNSLEDFRKSSENSRDGAIFVTIFGVTLALLIRGAFAIKNRIARRAQRT